MSTNLLPFLMTTYLFYDPRDHPQVITIFMEISTRLAHLKWQISININTSHLMNH